MSKAGEFPLYYRRKTEQGLKNKNVLREFNTLACCQNPHSHVSQTVFFNLNACLVGLCIKTYIYYTTEISNT